MEQNNFATNMENKENQPFTNLVPQKSFNFLKPNQCDANMRSENKGSSMQSMISADSKCSNMSVCNSKSNIKSTVFNDNQLQSPSLPSLASKLRRMSIDGDDKGH